MNIDFLYYQDCPSHDIALERLRQVMAEQNIQAEIEILRVETEEQAQRLAFTGSPTIRVNGMDIDPPPPGTANGLTCRAYHLDDGRISPLPPLEMIRRAFEKRSDHR
jgi:hypothetical protein